MPKGIVVGCCRRGLGGGVGEAGVLSVHSLPLIRTSEPGDEETDCGEIADQANVTRRRRT